jgi:parvulin-like peptidyl-prolyl isomerase
MKKKRKLPNILKRKRKQVASPEPIIPNEAVPRITNETIAAHREEVLTRARKYIYPLQHSKHRIVTISVGLFIVLIVAFFTYSTLALYKFQNTSTFLYRVTQVIPFPIARTGGRFVAYENYLFELRHYMHYYENQQELDFDTDAGQKQLAEYKRRALEKVINDAYIKQLAARNGVTVTNQELDDQLEIVRSQNRLGHNEKVFEDVLKEFWGWSVDDFKRSLRQQILTQKVLAKLDTETTERAKAALAELRGGADFAAMAQKYSDDLATKDSGGEFPFLVEKANPELTAQTTEALFSLQNGQTSDVINIGYALEIVKTIEKNNDRVRGAHILFNYKDISTFLNDLKEEQKARAYISFPKAEEFEDPELPQ